MTSVPDNPDESPSSGNGADGSGSANSWTNTLAAPVWPPPPLGLPSHGIQSPEEYKDELRRIASAQRLVICAVLVEIFVYILISALGLPLLRMLGLLGSALFQVITAVKLGVEIKRSVIPLAIGSVIPFISLLVLLHVVGEATNVLRAGGVKVGLLGANPNSIR